MTRRCSAFLNAELAFSCWFGSFKFKRTCGEHKRLSSNNLIQAGSFPTRQMDFYSRSQFIKNANSLKRLSLQPVTALSSIRIFRIRSTFLKKNKKKNFSLERSIKNLSARKPHWSILSGVTLSFRRWLMRYHSQFRFT